MADKSLSLYFVAGEASGDLHGARLMAALWARLPRVTFHGHGGDKMKAAGLELQYHSDDLSLMGFTEVIKHLPFMMKVMGETVNAIAELQPDRIILIDYPGFNLRLLKRIAALNIPVTYFILPQVWAWKEKRLEILKTHVDQAISIFPFEPAWFRERGLVTDYVGHPLVDREITGEQIQAFLTRHELDSRKPILVLLPGSRQQEVDRHWPVFINTAQELMRRRPDLQCVVGQAPGVELPLLPPTIRREITDIPAAIHQATAALAASGTVTLEAALLDTPVVVCYRLSPLSWWLAKRLVRVPYASMVNLIGNKDIVPEFLQASMKEDNLVAALEPLLTGESRDRKMMLADFETVRRALGMPGVYDRIADTIARRLVES
ncbi:MAG: lipid-A-disaccharide synthase [Fidelibacterota bacterium]